MNPQLARAMPFVAIGTAVVAVGLATVAVIKTRLGGGDADDGGPVPVEKWTVAWHAARACLVGSPQASSALPEALLARDLVAGDVESCARHIVDLRGVTPDGPEWIELQRHIGTLAEAYTKHRVRIAQQQPQATDDTLAPSIGTLDVAGTRLRDAAGLPPAEPPAPLALPVLTATPLVHDGTALYLYDIQSGGLIVRHPSTGDYAYVKFFGTRTELEHAPYLGGSVWSTDGSWKLSSVDRGSTRTLYAEPPQERLTSGGPDDVMAIAALGRDDTRFALYYDRTGRYLARSADGGESWTKSRVPGEYGWVHAASANGGRLDMGYWDDDGFWVLSLSVTQNASGRLPTAVRVARGEAATSCDTGALWLVLVDGDEYAIRRADSGEIARFRQAPTIRACSGEKALIMVDDVERLCSTTECRIVPTARDAGAGFVGDTLIRHAVRGDMVAVWRDFGEPSFVRTPPYRTFAGVIERDGAAVAVLKDADEATELAQLP